MQYSLFDKFAERSSNIGIWVDYIYYYNLTHIEAETNGRTFADDIFKRIFLNKNGSVSIKISLKFVSKGPIVNNTATGQIMLGADQVTKHYLNQCLLDYRRIYAPFTLNELNVITLFFSQSCYKDMCCLTQHNIFDYRQISNISRTKPKT